MRVARLDEGEVALAREQRLYEIEMWSIVREFVTYFIFLSLLFLVTYSSISPNAFDQVRHLRRVFHNSRQTGNDFTRVSTSLPLNRRRETMHLPDLAGRHVRSVLALASGHVRRQSTRTAVVQRTSTSESLGLPQRQVQPSDRLGHDETTARTI